MQPTAAYLESKSTSKYRLTAENGTTHAAIEHEGIGCAPAVYFSTDGGRTYTLAGWNLSLMRRIGQGLHGLEWPIEEPISELRVEPGFLVIKCAQSNPNDIVWRRFRYDIQKGIWR